MLSMTPGMLSNWKCLVGKRSLPGSRYYLAKELLLNHFYQCPAPLDGSVIPVIRGEIKSRRRLKNMLNN